jgi:hypothetical protein
MINRQIALVNKKLLHFDADFFKKIATKSPTLVVTCLPAGGQAPKCK